MPAAYLITRSTDQVQRISNDHPIGLTASPVFLCFAPEPPGIETLTHPT